MKVEKNSEHLSELNMHLNHIHRYPAVFIGRIMRPAGFRYPAKNGRTYNENSCVPLFVCFWPNNGT